MSLGFYFRPVFQNIARLAMEMFADRFECGEADGPGFAGFEDGQILRGDVHAVGQVVQPHFADGVPSSGTVRIYFASTSRVGDRRSGREFEHEDEDDKACHG